MGVESGFFSRVVFSMTGIIELKINIHCERYCEGKSYEFVLFRVFMVC